MGKKIFVRCKEKLNIYKEVAIISLMNINNFSYVKFSITITIVCRNV